MKILANIMLMYGEGPQGLADSRGLSMDEAQATIKKVLKAMPGIDKTSQTVQEYAKQNGYVTTISGHVRRLPNAMTKINPAKQSRALRQSFNCVIQGSGAVCTNTALILIDKALRDYHLKSRLVITVHDSLMLDCPKSEIPTVPMMAQAIMQHLPIKEFILEDKDFSKLKIADKYRINDHQFRFPLIANIEWGRSYGNGLKFDLKECKQLGIDKYYEYGMKKKLIDDTYNTQLEAESDDDKKAQIVKKRDTKDQQLHDSYFGKAE